MDERTAQAVIKCLEIDCDFYRELHVFLMKKHTKILDDDLDWLTNWRPSAKRFSTGWVSQAGSCPR